MVEYRAASDRVAIILGERLNIDSFGLSVSASFVHWKTITVSPGAVDHERSS